MNLGPHADFIVAAYAVTLFVVAALVAWVRARLLGAAPHSRRSRGARRNETLAAQRLDDEHRSSEGSGKKRRNVLMLLPLIVFIALAALFFYRLGTGDPSHLPSALIGRPVPATDLPPLPGLERDGKAVPGLSNATFQGAVTLVNVWASWCVPCHDEVPFLEQLVEGQAHPARRHQLQGRAGQRTAISSIATAILLSQPAATKPAAPRSTGASMACRRLFWSAVTAASPTSWSARSRRTISPARSKPEIEKAVAR